MEILPIKKIYAQSNTTSHPTIPFVPPGGSGTPTPTTTPTTVGPIIDLTTSKTSYAVGEQGTIEIKIDTKGQQIDEFKIAIQFDSSHVEIIDADPIDGGVQIEYLDTHFVAFENKVETNLSIDSAGQDGMITINASAQNSQAATVSNRTIAKINFRIKSAKVSEFEIIANDSNLQLSSVNILDSGNLDALEISSAGIVSPSPTPTGGKIPDTALETPGSIAIVTIGILLVVAGVMLKNKIESRKQHTP